jgi:hypothetical protein
MEIITYSKLISELKQACSLDPSCAALIFDSSTGELVAWHGSTNLSEAVSAAAAFYGCWNSQAEVSGQHDDQLEELLIMNEKRLNCLSQIKGGNKPIEELYTVALIGPNDIHLGAIKRMCKQAAGNLTSILLNEPTKKK